MPENVLVVGAPRSGTSLTASIFAEQGYYVAEDRTRDVRVGDEGNPFGYWEAEGVIEHNVELFKLVGFRHHNTWLFDEIAAAQAEAIDRLEPSEAHRAFVSAYEAHTPWMWKDPRLCYTLAYWWGLVDHARTRVVLVTRDPRAVYRSFRRLNWCGPGGAERERALRRIEAHFRNARRLVETHGIPHITVDYDEYLRAGPAVAERINLHCGLSLTTDDLNVRRDLNHSGLRGRVFGTLKSIWRRVPRGPARLVQRMVPRWVVRLILPERRYVPSGREDDPST